jgi:hypothetical protein
MFIKKYCKVNEMKKESLFTNMNISHSCQTLRGAVRMCIFSTSQTQQINNYKQHTQHTEFEYHCFYMMCLKTRYKIDILCNLSCFLNPTLEGPPLINRSKRDSDHTHEMHSMSSCCVRVLRCFHASSAACCKKASPIRYDMAR